MTGADAGADAGSQAERTRLAWRRTVLIASVSTLLLLRLAVERDATWLAPAGLATWLVGAVAAQTRIRALAADDHAPAGREFTVAVLVTIGYVALGTAAVFAR